MKDDKPCLSQPKGAQKPRKCPKCGKKYRDYPALSREDNKTEICPECGVAEALWIFKNNTPNSSRFLTRSSHRPLKNSAKYVKIERVTKKSCEK